MTLRDQTAVGIGSAPAKAVHSQRSGGGISGVEESSEVTATENKVPFQKDRTPEPVCESHTFSPWEVLDDLPFFF